MEKINRKKICIIFGIMMIPAISLIGIMIVKGEGTIIGEDAIITDNIVALSKIHNINRTEWNDDISSAFVAANATIYAKIPLAYLKINNAYNEQCLSGNKLSYSQYILNDSYNEAAYQIESDRLIALAIIEHDSRTIIKNGIDEEDTIYINGLKNIAANDLYNQSLDLKNEVDTQYYGLLDNLSKKC